MPSNEWNPDEGHRDPHTLSASRRLRAPDYREVLFEDGTRFVFNIAMRGRPLGYGTAKETKAMSTSDPILSLAAQRSTFSTSENSAELVEALSAARGQIKLVKRSKVNDFFHSSYGDLGDVMQACTEALASHGLVVVQGTRVSAPESIDKVKFDRNDTPHPYKQSCCRVDVTTRLMHKSGQWMEATGSAYANGTEPQPIGSTTTYLRRYGIGAMLTLGQDDDDGNAGSGRSAGSSAAAPSRTRAQAPRTSAPAAKLDGESLARREALHRTILAHCEGDEDEARALVKDCTTGKDFDGFTDVKRLTKDWQVANAVARFEKTSGETVAVKQIDYDKAGVKPKAKVK